jgi:hypothetical protein
MKSNVYGLARTTLFLLFIIVSILNTTSANAQELSASQYLTEIHNLYSERFDQNGKYIDNPEKTARFTERQIQVIQVLRKNKMVGSSFQIFNTKMNSLVITVSVVQETNHQFVGLLIERSQYENTNTASFLRLFDFAILKGGMDVLRFPEGTVIRINGLNLGAFGGQLQITYPLDFNQQHFATEVLTMNVDHTATIFLSPEQKVFSKMTLDLWLKIFSQNFGVRDISYQ